MNRECDLLMGKKPDSASTESRVKGVIRSLSTESRVKGVIRSLQEVDKVLEKINGDKEEPASS